MVQETAMCYDFVSCLFGWTRTGASGLKEQFLYFLVRTASAFQIFTEF